MSLYKAASSFLLWIPQQTNPAQKFWPILAVTLTMSKPTTTKILRNSLYKTTTTASLPTRDDLLSFLLDPSTSQLDLHTVHTLLSAAAAVSALPKYQALQHEHNTPKHCARCHATFTDNTNGSTACVVPHVFDDASASAIGADHRRFEAACCRAEIIQEMTHGRRSGPFTNMLEVGVHFEGSHTEDVQEVSRDMEGGSFNGSNIRWCKVEDGECVRDVLDVDENPIFYDGIELYSL
ncbi:hypothetical protein DXG03_004673 [Asterophora parasitica]|uniref:Uncharacterized protein n=1 Tax=Asterophora parasitica TaxID=117018 RepID=A0A9P7G6A9_9AGAR|nr:hypothetical protein DXG03_004673 [Asterophora parasitica]